MTTHEAAQQTVLELLGAPDLGQRGATAWEQFLTQRSHGEHVKQRPVRIEGEGLDALEAVLRLGSRREAGNHSRR